MNVVDFAQALPKKAPTAEQAKNIDGILKIGRQFHQDCGIPEYTTGGQIVFESGHQTNFVPHCGVWRKVFMLDRLAEAVPDSIPVFGFADYNLSTASLLYQSKIPQHNREGCWKIGFTIKAEDRWKRFDTLPKPGKAAFETLLVEIRSAYEHNARRAGVDVRAINSNIDRLVSVFDECYAKSESFADLNSYFFARVCTELLGLKALFFRYKDVQSERLFLEAAQKLAAKSEEFAAACNDSVRKRGLADELGSAEDYYFPFWLHCRCGGKVTMSLYEGQIRGRCPVCETGHRFGLEDFGKHYPEMAPTAIARNLVFSEGLGTTLFVSGAGGGLRYGSVANDASDALGFHKPTTMAWKGRDYYLGAAHRAALTDFARTLEVSLARLSEDDLPILLGGRRRELESRLSSTPETDKKTRQKYQGQLKNVETQGRIAYSLFSTTPSAFDVFANVGLQETLRAWQKAYESAEVEDGEFKTVNSDVVYSPEAPSIYKKIASEK